MKNNMKHPNYDWKKHAALTEAGAPRPADSSPLANDWAANNPTPAAIALGKLDIVTPMMQSMKAIATGARPIEN